MEPPSELKIDALNTATPNLADKHTLADGPPGNKSRDALNTSTQKLANEPNLHWPMDLPMNPEYMP